ncbi:unnamed protein product [Brassica rapa]|uniref:Uncharacterized protein n=1 Tax=Brassica campestris TaxID=3711 RepID=A0A8D9FYI6_BRACM|nr:unnamed protein product [Brassica rapa]
MDDFQGSRPYWTESLILPIGDYEGDTLGFLTTVGNLSYSAFKLTIHFLCSYLKPRLVELHRRPVTVGDHIFSDCKLSIF